MGLGLRGLFYGWWIVVAGASLNMLNGGIYNYGFSALLLPLTAEFGWSRAALSGVMSLARLESGLLGPVEGFLVDRFGPRALMQVGIAIMGIGFMVLSQVNDLPTFSMVFILVVSLGSSVGFGLPIQVAVANWFIRKRSRAMGFLTAGLALGGVLISGFVWLIDKSGWRTTVILSGLFIWAIGFPMSFVVRHRPEDYGLLPDGGPVQPSLADDPMPKNRGTRFTSGDNQETYRGEIDFTAMEALKTAAFWLMGLSFGLSSVTAGVIIVHYIPFLVNDIGVSPQMAAAVLGGYAAISAISRPIAGWVGDFVNKRLFLAACLGMQGMMLFLFSRVNSPWQLIFIVPLFAVFYGGPIPLRPALQAEYFGRRFFGTISGMLRFLDLWGIMSGPVIAGWIFDTTGSYRTAFVLIAATSLVAGLVILLAVRPTPKTTLKAF